MSDAQTRISAEAQVNKLGIPAVILTFQNGSIRSSVGLDANLLDQVALMELWTLLVETRERALQLFKFEDWDTTPVLYMLDGSPRCTYAEDHGGSVEDVAQCEWEANHTNALHSFQPGRGSEIVSDTGEGFAWFRKNRENVLGNAAVTDPHNAPEELELLEGVENDKRTGSNDSGGGVHGGVRDSHPVGEPAPPVKLPAPCRNNSDTECAEHGCPNTQCERFLWA